MPKQPDKKSDKKKPGWGDVKKALKKKYGGRLFDRDEAERIPTRFLRLDHVIGGGIPLGRIIELFGPEGGYKSTLALEWIADLQAATRRRIVYLDHEHSYDKAYAEGRGVDTKRLVKIMPDYFEQGIDAAIPMIETGEVVAVVLDSVAGLAVKAAYEAEVEKQSIASLARGLGRALYKLTPILSEHKTTLIAINQLREKPGVVFGNPETTPGGRALKHAASLRLRLSSTQAGVMMSVHKNKLTGVRTKLRYTGTASSGFDLADEALQLGLDVGVVTAKEGGFYQIGKHKFRGRDAVQQAAEKVRPIIINAGREA